MNRLTVTQKKFFTFWDAKFVMALPMLERLKEVSIFEGKRFANTDWKHCTHLVYAYSTQAFFCSYDWIFFIFNIILTFFFCNKFLDLFIYLSIYLLIFLFIDSLIYFLSIYYLFISITAEHKVAFFTFCLLLYVRLSTASVLVCLFVSMFFEVFLSKCLAVSVSLIWLFGCYPAPVFIFAKCRYCYFKFSFCNISFIFINHHPSFFISFFHPSIGREFNMLSSSGIIYPYPSVVWVSRLN